jgi:hypothetical protein
LVTVLYGGLCRFIWREFAAGAVFIKGEFTGWKEEEMRLVPTSTTVYLLA